MRTAFQLWPALDHRSTASRIASVAVTESGDTLYLGLSDGQVEEHSVTCTQHGVKTSLRARKHFGKKVSIVSLPLEVHAQFMQDLSN